MEDHFVNYNQALALKELGFDEPCIAFYSKQLLTFHTHGIDPHFIFKRNTELWSSPSAPLKSQVFKWFRDKHGLYSSYGTTNDFDEKINGYVISVFNDGVRKKLHINWEVGTYEEAESECIDKLISIIKEKKS
ncbi:MAG: hypothetical protein RIR01_2323 [Bacteroidota bacterium]|jgi:hypothetical protein